MPNIAFVTYTPDPAIAGGDQLIADALTARGATVTPVPWDDPSVDWTGFDAAVIRSTWNYFDHPQQFAQWLDRMEAQGVRLLNSVRVVRWNMVKTYLRELSAAGVRVVPTAWVEQHATPDLAAIVAERGWGAVLLKPTISGGAIGIQKVAAGTASAHQADLERMASEGVVMIQPLLKEIHDGEISIFFANGKYTHSVRKFPAPDNIFVQAAYGGYTIPHEPAKGLVGEAAQILDAARILSGEERFVYARVDGVMLDGHFNLMELEVLEPYLFIDQVPQAADAYAEAILAAL